MTLTMASDVFEFRLHGVGTTIKETKAVREGEVMTLIDVNFIVSCCARRLLSCARPCNNYCGCAGKWADSVCANTT